LLSGWISQATSCARRAHVGARDRLARQERRLRVNLVEIFDDGERLRHALAGFELEHRQAHLRIDRPKGRLAVEAAFRCRWTATVVEARLFRLNAIRTR